MKLRHVRAVAVVVVVLVVLTGARKSDGGGCGSSNNDNNHHSSTTSGGSGGHKNNVDGPAGSDLRVVDCSFQKPGGRTMVAEVEIRNGANVPYTYQATISFTLASAEGQEVGSGELVGFTVPAGQTQTTQVTAVYGGSGTGETQPLCQVSKATKRR